MKRSIIPPLSVSDRKSIKDVVKLRYGVDGEDKDIDWIDDLLRSQYSVHHHDNIIRRLVTVYIDRILLKYRDKMGSINFERALDKLIFHYLTYAKMSYRSGIPICSIFLCRTALEAGLRERIAEKLAEEKIRDRDRDKLPQRIWESMEDLMNKKLSQLIDLADKEGIITKDEIEKFFKNLKLGEYESRKVFDKFIHSDFSWIVNFVENKYPGHAKVVGAKDVLEERKILADVSIKDVAVNALIGTTLVAERLYFKDHKND